MPANVTVEEVSSSSILLSADSPPVKPVREHGGLGVVSWRVTYQAETDRGAPIGREATATFYNGRTLLGPVVVNKSVSAVAGSVTAVAVGPCSKT